MKCKYRPELSGSCRGMACAMSRCDANDSAVRFFSALRFDCFGFRFTKIPVRESRCL